MYNTIFLTFFYLDMKINRVAPLNTTLGVRQTIITKAPTAQQADKRHSTAATVVAAATGHRHKQAPLPPPTEPHNTISTVEVAGAGIVVLERQITTRADGGNRVGRRARRVANTAMLRPYMMSKSISNYRIIYIVARFFSIFL